MGMEQYVEPISVLKQEYLKNQKIIWIHNDEHVYPEINH